MTKLSAGWMSRPSPEPSVATEVGECVHCHRAIMSDDATDESGLLHFEPCVGEAAAMLEDMIVDRARDERMMREQDRP